MPQRYKKNTTSDCENGWPPNRSILHDLPAFYQVRDDLECQRGLLLKGDRIVILIALQNSVLNKIH